MLNQYEDNYSRVPGVRDQLQDLMSDLEAGLQGSTQESAVHEDMESTRIWRGQACFNIYSMNYRVL
jgi:hypothetical protein